MNLWPEINGFAILADALVWCLTEKQSYFFKGQRTKITSIILYSIQKAKNIF